MTREKEFEKQKTVRELAYTELKLELMDRCCVIHYIPSEHYYIAPTQRSN